MRTKGTRAVRRSVPVSARRATSPLGQDLDALMPYVVVARASPPLSRDEEFALATRARAGDAAARELLVRHNVAFVLSMCRRQANRGVRLDDLVQEGMYGLLKAVQHFDPSLGNRFSTYAAWWIRAYVQKSLKELRAVVKPQIAGPGEAVVPLPRDVSLDAPLGDEEGSTRLEQLASDDEGPDALAARSDESRAIREALVKVGARLGPVGRAVVAERLASADPRTLEELGRELGLSRERVRQVEVSTRQFLSHWLEPFAA